MLNNPVRLPRIEAAFGLSRPQRPVNDVQLTFVQRLGFRELALKNERHDGESAESTSKKKHAARHVLHFSDGSYLFLQQPHPVVENEATFAEHQENFLEYSGCPHLFLQQPRPVVEG